MLLTKEQLRVAPFASSDHTRPVLTRIRATRDKETETITTVATDGYVLAEIIAPADDVSEYPKIREYKKNNPVDTALIDADIAKKIAKAIPKPKDTALPVLNHAIVEDGVISTTDLETTTSYAYREPEGDYPDYKQLLPKKPSNLQVAVNPKYLIKAAEMFEKYEGMTIELGEKKMDPIVLRSDSNGVQKMVVIMPLKS